MGQAGTAGEGLGVLVISLDFELAWGMRAFGDDWRNLALQARALVPRLLELLVRYQVHATWATVGLIMCEDAQDALAQAPEFRPRWADPRLDSYAALASLRAEDHAAHFAPDLVRQISAAPGQELGTHTFAHYPPLDAGYDELSFREDLRAAIRVTQRYGPPARSLVFPRNQVPPQSLPVCAQEGIEVYRGTLPGLLEQPRSLREGSLSLPRALRLLDAHLPLRASDCYPVPAALPGLPLNLPGSRQLRPGQARMGVLDRLKLRRVLRGMHQAARRGLVCHLWCHPHNFVGDTEHKLEVLEQVLAEGTRLRDSHGLRSLNMGEVADLHRGVAV